MAGVVTVIFPGQEAFYADTRVSSAATTRWIQAEIVKLDQGLTSQVDTDPPRRAMVTAMRQFADEMGIDVVAEGIEREEQLVVLRDIGIDCGQGYLLGRPGPLPA